MSGTNWIRLVRFFAKLLGIWYITADMPPSEVVQDALKKWGKPSIAFTHLLQKSSSEVNILSANCMLWGQCRGNASDELSSPQLLRKLLEGLPEYYRANAFLLAVNNDVDFGAFLLIQLTTPVIPGLTSVARDIAMLWSKKPRHDDLALAFYQSLSAYGAPYEDIRWVLARAFVARGFYTQAEALLLDPKHSCESTDSTWLLITVLRALHRPHEQVLAMIRYYIEQSQASDSSANAAWDLVKNLYETMFEKGTEQERAYYVRTLHRLLEQLPETERAAELSNTASENDVRIARLLIAFAAHVLSGLETLVKSIVEKWAAQSRYDDLALAFYRLLPAYGISQEDTDLLLSRAYLARKQYVQAEPLLEKLAHDQPSPDRLWQLSVVYSTLQRSPRLLLETMLKFTNIAPSDTRLGQAWKCIGDLYGEHLGEGMEAVQAYQRAESLGVEATQLLAYRMGNWEAIPALRVHPDYGYPVLTFIDLEVDPQQDGRPGDRVFEVAAVRIKGKTILRTYTSYVRRSFRPAKMKSASDLEDAPEPNHVASQLRGFIGNTLVVGHNLRAFDADQLSGMGVPILEERIIDTLIFARLLYPDSLHHHLGLLCQTHHIQLHEGDRHTALPDGLACAKLFHALSDELVHRGGTLLAGFRALVSPGSAFDRAVLQPRKLGADPSLPWSLVPEHSVPHILVQVQGFPASNTMQKVLSNAKDAVIELHDPEGAYVKHLPAHRRTIVSVYALSRLEQMLAAYEHKADVYILPDPLRLLCPHRLRNIIEDAEDSDYKLMLFCLYQASHNKDTGMLFPMRLPADEPNILRLRQDLMRACCSADTSQEHHATCSATLTHLNACKTHRVMLATHEVLSHQKNSPEAALIVIDDVAELQMHLAEYVADSVSSDQLQSSTRTAAEQHAFESLHVAIETFARQYIPQPGYHERLPLSGLTHYLFSQDDQQRESDVINELECAGPEGQRVAEQLRQLCKKATQDAKHPEDLHADWIDLWFPDDTEKTAVRRWAICGVHANLPTTFLRMFWQPYAQHILCGTAISTYSSNLQFLERSLGLPNKLPFYRDSRPKSRVYLPSSDIIPPVGFLRRRSWAMQVGTYLYALQAQEQARTILVTMNNRSVAKALANAFDQTKHSLDRQVLATQFHWTTAKIAERMRDPDRRVLVMVSPRTRQTYLPDPVDIEVTGPLLFLQQQDPLVVAHMRVFAQLYQAEGPFMAYLLPQALLELKSRLASNAQLHVILDSRLYSAVYRDELEAMLTEIALIVPYQALSITPLRVREARADFLTTLSKALEQQGFSRHDKVSDDDLKQALQAIWHTDQFNEFHRDNDIHAKVTQKDIVRGVLDGKDQLLVAATGGGKSLCYQLPAVFMAEEMPPKVTLVFSPLISLMSNQVDDLRRKGIFSAIVLNSTLSAIQRQEHLRGLQRGDYSIVYIAPEQIRSGSLRRALEKREIGLIAIDEAHCLSQWGHDFRTEYFAVKDWIARMNGSGQRHFPILALTATARKGFVDADEASHSDQRSTIKDIIEKLDLHVMEQQTVITSPQRSELEFLVEQVGPEPQKCTCGEMIGLKIGKVKCKKCGTVRQIRPGEVQAAVEKMKLLCVVELLTDTGANGLRQRWDKPSGIRQKGLIYCTYRKTTTFVADELHKRLPGLRIGTYSAELEITEREAVLQRFTRDDEDGLDIVVATNAFGMGIDVRRLGFVIHFDTPGSLEAYYQEAGRAGRDAFFRTGAERAKCILLYHPSDLDKQRYLSRKNSITELQVRAVYDVLCELRNDACGRNRQQAANGASEQELICTEQEIATRAGISKDTVQMILHYLEYHSLLNGANFLGQGETANRVLRLKFEPEYEERYRQLPATSSSRPLLQVFRTSAIYRLTTDSTTTISLKELADSQNWPISSLEHEIRNLVQRRIIAYDCDGRIRWTQDAAYARSVLNNLKQDIAALLYAIIDAEKSKRKKSGFQSFMSGEPAYVDINDIITKKHLNAVAPHVLLRFLSTLSHSDGVDNTFRLFKRFTRNTRYAQPGKFEVRLWTDNNCDPAERFKKIFSDLVEAIALLERLNVTEEEDIFDLLVLEPNIYKRHLLHQQLLLLDMLDVLKYKSDPALGLALRVTFTQPSMAAAQPNIDLSELRLKETYEKNKLKLMARYATETTPEERAKEFAAYFYGEKPLVEQVEQLMRTDLNQDQLRLITLEKGYHLIEGPAGCGKTTVLVEFIKHLVFYKHLPIDHIMVTAHFNSAVNRIAKELEVLQEDEGVALSTTINSFGEKIFRKYRSLLLSSNGQPYYEHEPELKDQRSTERQDQMLVSKALTNIFAGTWQSDPWPVDLERPLVQGAYRPDDAREKQCLEDIRRLCEHGIFPTSALKKEQLEHVLGKDEKARAFEEIEEDRRTVARKQKYPLALRYAVYVVYLQLKGQKNYYNFDDQVLFGLAILQQYPGIAREYQHFYEYVLVDELQDFTPAQAKLFLKLCEVQHNVLVFGDRDQAIRPKKTEAPSVFDELQEQDSCQLSHQLTVNFRSTQQILNLISRVRNFEEKEQRPHLLSATDMQGKLPVLLEAYTSPKQVEGWKAGVSIEEMVQAALDQLEQLPEQERGSVALIVAKSDWATPVINYLRTGARKKYEFSVLGNTSDYQLHHVDRVLVYLRLIKNPHELSDIERLLRYCVVPYFTGSQIKKLKDIKRKDRRAMLELLQSEQIMKLLKVTAEQRTNLHMHLDVIKAFSPESSASQVFDMLRGIEGGPFEAVADSDQKYDELTTAVKSFTGMTVAEVLAHVQQHLTFLEESRKHSGLVVTTIDHAKSEEFDTVFYLGADYLLYPGSSNAMISYKRRFYVSISRARKLLFLVMDGESWKRNRLLSSLPKTLYHEEIWSLEKSLAFFP
jgi:superfamily II DNA helicase RecQ/superfamily I DNA/RNA helicase/DNA polymerase III epsilon subunit-like protein